MAKVAGLAFLATGLLLASCTTDASNLSSQIDTVLNLSAPVVKATAYPGMNYVSWKPVANANGYEVFVYEDDHYVRTISYDYDVLNYKDVDLKNDTKYTYYVEATSKSSTGRSVVTENTMSEGVSVTAIVPDYNVKALELVDHEKGIGQAGDKNYILSASNIHVARDFKDKLSISFPTKAYLNYDVQYYIDNEYEVWGNINEISGGVNYFDNASNDKIMPAYETPLTVGGVYHVVVVANAENGHFGSSNPIVAEQTITVATLSGTVDENTEMTASYVNANKIRVVFPKFVLDNGKTAPAQYYKVYHSCKDTPYNYTAVFGSVKSAKLFKTDVFYVEDAVTDNTVDYIYTLVVTDGERFAANVSTANVGYYVAADQTATTVTGAASTEDTDGVANDITWTITLSSKDVEITGVYILEKTTTDDMAISDSEDVASYDFDTSDDKNLVSKLTPATETDGTVFYVYTKDHTVGKTVYMLVTTKQADKADGEWLSAGVDVKYGDVTAPTVTVAKYDNRLDHSTAAALDGEHVLNDVVVSVIDSISTTTDSIGNYTYTLYVAKSTLADDIADGGTITFSYSNDWEAGMALTLEDNSSYDSSAASHEYSVDKKYTDLSDGIYAYKVVKTNKTSGVSTASDIVYVVIETKDTIAYVPSTDFTVEWKEGTTAKTKTAVIKFVKNNTANDPIYLTKNDLPVEDASHICGYVSETPESPAVTYKLYRAKLVKGKTDVVYEFVDNVTSSTATQSSDKTIYKWTDSNKTATEIDTSSYKYDDFITYKYEDPALDTAYSYSYLIVCTKADSDDAITNLVTLAGSN